jgi:hypothetical protein
MLFTQHSPARQQIFFKPVVRFEDHIQDDFGKGILLTHEPFSSELVFVSKNFKKWFFRGIFFS